MNAIDRLSNNKVPFSSALSKALAQNILNGQTSLLLDCIDLVCIGITAPAQQQVRTGASRVIEIVALNRPDLVAPYLHKLIPALSAHEYPTSSMIIRTMGFCAHLNKLVARDAISYVEKFIFHKEGLTLASSTDLFLGDFGAISRQDAQTVFPLLERSMQNLIINEQDALLDALFRIFPNLAARERDLCFAFAERWQDTPRKGTRRRVKRLLRLRG